MIMADHSTEMFSLGRDRSLLSCAESTTLSHFPLRTPLLSENKHAPKTVQRPTPSLFIDGFSVIRVGKTCILNRCRCADPPITGN